MTNRMKTGITLALALCPLPVLAQQAGGIAFSAILLTIAIVLGLASCLYVFVLSSRFQGGGIGRALRLYGIGMLAVVISLLTVTWLKTFAGQVAGTLHDVFFIVGFIVMVMGSASVARLFRGEQ